MGTRSTTVVTPLLLALSLGCVTACRRAGSRGELRRNPDLSVLLITIDTLRADALGSYGHGGGASPVMDRLAATGVRFTSAHAHNVVTLPSHVNILTGRLPTEHGVRDNAGFRLADDVPTLATILKERGYRTAAFVSAFPLDSRFGLARGFDVYDDRLGGAEHGRLPTMQERRGRETAAAAKRWLDAQEGARTFLWVHLYDPHFPYAPPEPFAARFTGNPYQGEVAETDDALGDLLRPLLLATGGVATLVVLTADHGESLGEHEEATHGIFAYEATLRVPLIVHQPRLLEPQVVDAPVRHVDILPTVLDALDLPAPAGLPGASLLPVATGRVPPSDESYFEALSATVNRGWAPLYGAIRGRTKYVDLPLPELYDLASDPQEARNLAAIQPQRVAEMRDLLRRMRSGEAGRLPSREDAETRERLRALGYVAAAAPTRKEYTEADDPKRLMALDRQLERSLSLYARGDLAGALAACEDLVRQRPDMALALGHLGFLRRQAGDLDGAVSALKRALVANPDDAETASLLGVYLNEAGKAREAERVLAPYVARSQPDLEVLNAYGIALASLGRSQEALAAFQRVRGIDPSNVLALVNTGVVRLMQGDLERARADFTAALELDPGSARAHNSLGVIAARQGRPDAAVRHWQEAVRLDPHDFQTLYNLGMLLWRQGRRAEARPFLERYVADAPRGLEAGDVAAVRALLSASR